MSPVRNEAGETLIELLVTILVIAIGLVGVMGAMGGSILASDQHRGYAQGEVVLRDFGEAIQQQISLNKDDPATTGTNEYVACPRTAAADAADGGSTDTFHLDPTFTQPTGWNLPKITTVKYWIPGTYPDGTWTTNRQTCLNTYGGCFNAIAACDPGHIWVEYEAKNTFQKDYGKADLFARVLVRRADG